MASTKSDQNPDKRDRSKPKDYLSDWIKRQSLVEKMIPMIGNLHREGSLMARGFWGLSCRCRP